MSVGRVCTSGLLTGPQLMLADSSTKETCDVCMNTRQLIYTVGVLCVCNVVCGQAPKIMKLPESEAETGVLTNDTRAGSPDPMIALNMIRLQVL